MDLRELEETIRTEAATVARKEQDWTNADISRRLLEIADQLAAIRLEHAGGINASMGKRSGLKAET
ncbi:MAG: hypothetical protein JJD96_04615 [Thermoleophilia bacterium]|nr:hypothetical protein [Thermoleophilia bacterium]